MPNPHDVLAERNDAGAAEEEEEEKTGVEREDSKAKGEVVELMVRSWERTAMQKDLEAYVRGATRRKESPRPLRGRWQGI